MLTDYSYGRLSPDATRAVEAHVQTCSLCHAEGLRHIATERMQAMQQRPKPVRRSSQPLLIILSGIVALSLCTGGLLLLEGVRTGTFKQIVNGHQQTTLSTAIPTNTAVPTVAPLQLTSSAIISSKGIVSLAWSPDGKQLAVGANPTSLGGIDTGGVAIYANSTLKQRLPGFENHQAPGSLLWSPDGKKVAGSGRSTLFVWQVNATIKSTPITLPDTIGTELIVFDTTTGTAVGSFPSTLFVATGFVQWTSKGTLTSVSPPDPSSATATDGSSFALWGSQLGIRIFRDKNNITFVGMSDADRENHAAFLRWSPDGRYLAWGYPAVPISSQLATVTTATATAVTGTVIPKLTAVNAPSPAFGIQVNHVGQVATLTGSVILWPDQSGKRMILFDATSGQSGNFSVIDTHTGASLGQFGDAVTITVATLNMLNWQPTTSQHFALTAINGPVADFAPVASSTP